jgi:hypothetical protein
MSTSTLNHKSHIRKKIIFLNLFYSWCREDLVRYSIFNVSSSGCAYFLSFLLSRSWIFPLIIVVYVNFQFFVFIICLLISRFYIFFLASSFDLQKVVKMNLFWLCIRSSVCSIVVFG